MAIEADGVKFPEHNLNLEFRVAILEQMLEHLLNGGQMSPDKLADFRKKAAYDIKSRHPSITLHEENL